MTSPIGFGGPQGGGDNGADFESFRQKRQNRRFKTDGGIPSTVAEAKSKLQRAIEDEERKEMAERQLAREVQEFVEETTRLAASILNQVSTEEKESHHKQIGREMKEFFAATLHRAESMLESLRYMEAQGASVAELEATLANLSTGKLDEFRAEGSESLRDAHLGETPLLTPIEHHVEPEAPATGAMHLLGRSADWQTIEAQETPEDVQDEDHSDEEELLEDDGSCEMEPLGEDFTFIDDGSEEQAASGAWRAAHEDEAGSDVVMEEVTVETEFAADFVDENEEEALAADPEVEDDFPPFFMKWRNDKAALKKALTVMVRNGLMTPDEARSIFTRA